ncbi:MAG TPA: hypothetical protein VNU70_09160 [Puia sp.]|jgi:hypothetical protein|nr:hypothetical protein [Puia sp.]
MYHRLIAGFLLLVCNKSISQMLPQDSISKHTYVYTIKDANELGLDVYSKAINAGDSARCCPSPTGSDLKA